jgi:uncharacterized membrane protein YedE/YeeE
MLIGAGMRTSGRCTGSHPYCSSPILKKKSISGSLVAIIAGLVVATIRGWLPFLASDAPRVPSSGYHSLVSWIQNVLFVLMAIYTIFYMLMLLIKEQGIESSDSLVSVLIGILYGCGLMIGGALRPSIVIGFLNFSFHSWNPTLLILMMTVLLMN